MGSIVKIAFVYLNGERNVGRGAGYIASVILNAGYSLTFFDTVYKDLKQVSSEILANNYDILLISASTLFYKQAKELAKEIKLKNKNISILLGGAHATILREKILIDCSDFDYLCVGEGEKFILEFLKNYGTDDLFKIKNLVYWNKEGSVVGPTCNSEENSLNEPTNLNDLPKFRYDLFSPFSIVLNSPLPGFSYVFSTRGCPYNCSYCCNSYYLSIYKKGFLRKRSVDDVIEELKYLKETYRTKIFYFGDEMILFDKEYVTELFNKVKNEIGLPYGCMARVENINTDVVELFKSTGCKYVGMGIECGDEQFRKEFLNRHMSNEKIIESFRLIRTIPGIMITSYNMHGYPVDYDDRLLIETKKLNDIIKPDIMQMSLFFPFPGTKLYDYCIENNLIDYDKLNGMTEYFTKSVLRGH